MLAGYLNCGSYFVFTGEHIGSGVDFFDVYGNVDLTNRKFG